MKTSLSQIVVYVSDMRKSIAFYRYILGLELTSESERWSEFNAGDFHLALHFSNGREEVPGRVSMPAGRAELVFKVEDIHSASTEIREKGGAVEGPRLLEGLGVEVAFLRDPDGFALMLIQG